MELENLDMSKIGKKIKDELGGTDEDNKFIENLVYLSKIAVKQKDNEESSKVFIENNEKCIKCKINEIRDYIQNTDNQTNGIEHIKRMFEFLNDASNFGDDKEGNFYLFVANVKIKAAAFLIRIYLFIQKYAVHEEDEDEKSMQEAREEARDYVWDEIKKKIKDKPSLVEKISTREQDKFGNLKQSDYELKDYKLDIDKKEIVEETRKEEMGNSSYTVQNGTYKLTKETAADLNKCFGANNICDLEEQLLDRITVLLEINNKIAEITDKEKIGKMLKEKNCDNRSLRYFIFDNSMSEVEFYGVESRFNWLWEQEKNVYLYRNVSTKQSDEKTQEFEGKNGMEYMREFMERLISHINGENYMQAISYSRNPIRDFYKYIDIPKECNPINISFTLDIDEGANVNVTSKSWFDEENKAVFEIVENATTNSLAITKQGETLEEISFYNFLKKSDQEYDNTKFCIEFCKENAIVPACTGRRLIKLRNYLETWGINEKINFYVVSDNDDEVVTSIDYFKPDDNRCKQYKLNFIQILSVMYRLFEYEDERYSDVNNIDKKIKKCIETKYQNEMDRIKKEFFATDKNLTNSTYSCNGGISINFSFENRENVDGLEDNMHSLEQNLVDKINCIPKDTAEIILEEIKKSYKSDLIDEVVDEIEKGINKKTNYKTARKDEFKFFVGGNEVLSYWKQIFKDC